MYLTNGDSLELTGGNDAFLVRSGGSDGISDSLGVLVLADIWASRR